ncbi:DUF4436 family protein [Nocardia transvalensis]|uniref:DUF4436 family protein n=1 Tax=Nocardia transvalensis TaxID=37333 RepID=UPI001895B8C4|nr:DUF4436 family protein [Nocardia transvalensis]MBF6330320.1 DUF4436 family protein [Nocardia transvalensis]
MQHRAKSKQRGLFTALLAALALIAMVGAGLGMYVFGKHRADVSYSFGDLDRPDRVDVGVWVSRVDTATQTVMVDVNVSPQGALADDSGYFRSGAVLVMPSAAKSDPIKIAAGQPVSTIDTKFALLGTNTDYPFDRYRTRLAFQVFGADGHPLPTVTIVGNGDSFFKVGARLDTAAEPSLTVLDTQIKRSTPTLVFALFIMVLMLGLAVAAATAAYYVLRWRRGLLFPACSMMAAVLFALVPLRNAVPGAPPIGSIIDFASFFLAEAIISVALITSVLIGYRVEIAKEFTEQRLEAAPPHSEELDIEDDAAETDTAPYESRLAFVGVSSPADTEVTAPFAPIREPIRETPIRQHDGADHRDDGSDVWHEPNSVSRH